MAATPIKQNMFHYKPLLILTYFNRDQVSASGPSNVIIDIGEIITLFDMIRIQVGLLASIIRFLKRDKIHHNLYMMGPC